MFALRNPDRVDQPEPMKEGQGATVDPIAMLHRHEHVASTKDETWAFYRLEGVDWWGQSKKTHDAHLRDEAHRWADLADAGVTRWWGRCVQRPLPVDALLDEVEATGVRDRVAMACNGVEWAETRARIGALCDVGSPSRPMTVLGFRVADYRTEREHMPMLLQRDRCHDHLGKVEQTRLRVADVTAILQMPGLTGRPVTSEELREVLDRSIGLGLAPAKGEPGQVEPEADWYSDHIELHRADTGGTVHGCTQILHLSRPEAERDTEKVLPWLGWLSNVNLRAIGHDGRKTPPIHVEWAASFDLTPGVEAAKKIKYRAEVNHGLTSEGGATRDEQRAIRRGDQSADEAGHGRRDQGVRSTGCILVAVSAPYDPDGAQVAAAAKRVKAAASQRQRMELERRSGQYADYRKFIPCEPWGSFKSMGDRTHQTGYSLASAVCAMSMKAGDSAGWPVGGITDSREMMFLDPWGGGRRNRPNVSAVVGEPGAAKTTTVAGMVKWMVEQGHQTYVSSADSLIARLADVDTLRRHARVVDLGKDAPDGILMPGFLVPNRPRSVFDTDSDWEKAKREDERERLALTIDLVVSCLPWSEQEDASTARVVRNAVSDVAWQYGFQTGDIIDALNRHSKHGRELADSLRHADPRVWPRHDVSERLVEGATGDALLEIATYTGVQPPPKSRNRATWTEEQHQSVPILLGGTRLMSRRLWADRTLKAFVSDESGITTAGASSFSSFLVKLGMDSRKWGISSWLIFQTMSALLALDENIASLFGSAMVFRTEEENARSALKLTRLKPGCGWEERIASLPTGSFVHSGWDRKVRQVRVDRRWWSEDLKAATDTTPALQIPELVMAGGSEW